MAVFVIAMLVLPVIWAQNTKPKVVVPTVAHKTIVRPTIPSANRNQKGKVFLEHANTLSYDQVRDSNEQVLVGDVQLRKGGMFMYCDSARFNEATGSLDAFGNVRMEQGDTLFVYGDMLFYDGVTELAELRGDYGTPVRLINRDVKLVTDVFFYDMRQDVGFYETGGTLTDKQNKLTSYQGYYYPATKDAFFYLDVVLTGPRQNDTLHMYTDSLTYNTQTAVAQLMCPTLITNKDGEINSSSGFYETQTGIADLYDRSTVHTRRGNTLTGDTLFYDREAGYGEAFGNMLLTDSAKQSSLAGDYGFYNEISDSAFVTGRALAREYSNAEDTLYLHADTIIGYMLEDSTHVTNAFRRVRFYRSDIQGLCDSMSMVERDSIMYMYDYPVIWTGSRQIVGNVIYVHGNDSTADWARLPEYGLVSENIEEDCYNQMFAADMTTWMTDTVVDRVYAEGNVQVIMFPIENDSTYNKFSYVESSYMDAVFENNEVKRVKMWPETNGKVTPLYLAKKTSYFLPKFRWYETLRPTDPEDVFNYPTEMQQLFDAGVLGTPRPDAKTIRGTAVGRWKPEPLTPPESNETAVPEHL